MSTEQKILTEDEQNQLIAWRDGDRTLRFWLGDFANSKVSQVPDVPMMVVYSAIGKMAGKSGRTVRQYADIARRYNAEERHRYGILPYSVFVLASQQGDRRSDVLEHALSHPTITVDALEMWANMRYNPPTRLQEGLTGVSMGACTKVDAQPITAPVSGSGSTGFYSVHNSARVMEVADVMTLVERIEGLLHWTPLSPDVAEELSDCVSRIRRLLPRIQEAAFPADIPLDETLQVSYN